MRSEKSVNGEYKDRLFKFIFGNPEKKDWTLSLYNAVNGSSYENPEDIQLTTIDDAVYMGMKNDVSFLIADTMNFYEQQSTYNPNMPMRFLIYAGMVYAEYIELHDEYHPYSSAQQSAPAPKCICFYNGVTGKDDRIILQLSDTFAPDSDPDINVKVTMININYGHNRELMELCKPLEEYAWFVAEVRSNLKVLKKRNEPNSLELALDAALDRLPEDSLIRKFLLANKAEVKRMCITEYNEMKVLAQAKEDAWNDGRAEGLEAGRAEGLEAGRAEGKAEGRAEGFLTALIGLVQKGILTLSQAAEEAHMSVAEFEQQTGLKA